MDLEGDIRFKEAMNGLGIEYARTVGDSYNFEIPKDFLRWFPTMHQFAKAYWEPNQPEKDALEMAHFYKVIDDFLKTKELSKGRQDEKIVGASVTTRGV